MKVGIVKSKPKRLFPVKTPNPAYHQFWRIVDGAVRKTFVEHPEYLADARREGVVRASINKRVVGAFMSFSGDARRRTDPVE